MPDRQQFGEGGQIFWISLYDQNRAERKRNVTYRESNLSTGGQSCESHEVASGGRDFRNYPPPLLTPQDIPAKGIYDNELLDNPTLDFRPSVGGG